MRLSPNEDPDERSRPASVCRLTDFWLTTTLTFA
jgi:hypothetical protein